VDAFIRFLNLYWVKQRQKPPFNDCVMFLTAKKSPLAFLLAYCRKLRVLNIHLNSPLKITETLFLFIFNRWMPYQKGFSRKKGFDVKKMEGILIKRKLPNSNFKIQIKENFEKITSINLYNVITVKQN
jgi:hypothetical protein